MDKEPYIHEINLSTIGGTFSYDNEESLITHIFNNINLTKFTDGHLYVLYCYLDPTDLTGNTIKLIITVYSKEQVYSDACHDFKPSARTAKHTDGATRILVECETIFFNKLDLKDQETRKQLNTNLNKIYDGLLEPDNLLLKGQVGGEDIINAFIKKISPPKFPNVSSIKLPVSVLIDRGVRRDIRNKAIAALIAGTALSVAPKPPPLAQQLSNFSDIYPDEKKEADTFLEMMANPDHAHALHAKQETMAEAEEEEDKGEEVMEVDPPPSPPPPSTVPPTPIAITAAKIPEGVLDKIAYKVSMTYDSGAPGINDEPSNPEDPKAVAAFYEELEQISKMQAEAPAIPKAYDTGMPKPTNVQIGQVEEKIRIISFVRKEDKYYCQIIKPEINSDKQLSCKTTFKEYDGTTKTFSQTRYIESLKPNVAPLCELVENKKLLPIYALMAKFIADRLLLLAFFLYYFTKSICPLTLLYTHDRRPFLDIIYSNVKDENYDDYHVLVPGVFWSAPSAGDALYLRSVTRVNDPEKAKKINQIIADAKAAEAEEAERAQAEALAVERAAKAKKAKETRAKNKEEAAGEEAAAKAKAEAKAEAEKKGREARASKRGRGDEAEKAEKVERAAVARVAAAAEMDVDTQLGLVDAKGKTKRRRRRFKPKKIANQTIKQVKRISKRLKNKLIEKGRKTIKRFKKAKPETKKTRSKKINMYYKNTKPVKKIKNVRKFMKTLTPILFVKRLQNKATTRKNKTEQKTKNSKS